MISRHLVRGVSEEEADNECLGGDLDYYELEDNYMEAGSPELESGSKPVFEDGLDLNIDEMDVDRTGGKSTWELGPAPEDGGGWGGGSWGKKNVEPAVGGGWGTKKPDTDTTDTEKGSSWGQKVAKADEAGWGSKKSDDIEKGSGSGAGSWGQKVVTPSQPQAEVAKDSGQWGSTESWKAQTGSSAAWGKKVEDTPTLPTWNQGQKTVEKGKQAGSWTSWAKKDDKKDQSASQVEDSSNTNQWGKKEAGSTASWGKPVQKTDAPSWSTGGKLQVDVPINDETSRKWGAVEFDKPQGSDWSKKVEEKTESQGGWGDSWGKKKEENKPQDGTEGSNEQTDKGSNWGWNRKEEQKQDQGGWKKKEGWGPKRDHPARPVGGPNDGPRPGGPFTAARQRLDIFTPDEHEIINEINPIIQSIRRIMHQSGYNDGDPLSADDQTYILDNVFNHHPDKVQKTGAGVKHIMVNKHTKFQESRCFFVVSTDGREEDFSYIKCVENYVKVKYPDKFDEFKPKYFKKPQPRPPRDHRGPGLDEAGTPRSQSGWKCESNDESGTPRSQSGWKTNDESGTPRSQSGWKANDESGTPRSQSGWKTSDESGTPRSQSGWNNESSVAADAVAAPATSGWNKEASMVPEEGGATATGWNQSGSSSGATPAKSGWGS